MDSLDGHSAIQGALRNAIRAQRSLETYLHSSARENLLVESIHHLFAQRDFVRALLCATLSDQRVVSIFSPMVSKILRQQVQTSTREEIESMMPPSPGVWVHNHLFETAFTVVRKEIAEYIRMHGAHPAAKH